MSVVVPVNSTMGWKLYSYLEKYPKNYDVAFSVGPEKTIVKALKIILKSLSPVFEKEFEDCWDQAVLKEGEGIPLPDLDPAAFKLFIKKLSVFPADDSRRVDGKWTESVKIATHPTPAFNFHLPKDFNHVEIWVTQLNDKNHVLYRTFDTFVKTEDFLLLSEQQLESILGSEEISMSENDICQSACRWADEQCKKQKLEVTGSNHRLVLGNCLYEIRFPLMSFTELATVTRLNKGLLTTEETIEIFQFIGMDEKARKAYDTKQLKFKFEKRRPIPIISEITVSAEWSLLSLTKVIPVIDTPFVCDGSVKNNYFNTNTKIKLCGVGFLGPIDADSFYDVTVQIWKRSNSLEAAFGDKMTKRVFGYKSKTLSFAFDQPVVLDPLPFDSWRNAYIFQFTLKGPATRSLKSRSTFAIPDNNNMFTVYWGSRQLAWILYNVC